MARVTLNAVNRRLAEEGISGELVRGNGYFYFSGDSFDRARRTSVMTCHLTDYSIDEWIAEARRIMEDAW